MAKRSACLLLYRRTGADPEVLLVHPGGPFWAKKDEGAWSIPKGLFEEDESLLAAAKREFEEETGFLPHGTFIELGSFKQPNSKVIFAWAVEGDFDPRNLKCNFFFYGVATEVGPYAGVSRGGSSGMVQGWRSRSEDYKGTASHRTRTI